MLPSKVFQIDYQNFSYLVSKDLDKIKDFEIKNNFKFDLIISKLRNGTFPGIIISNELQIPLGILEAPRHKDYLDYRIFLPYEIEAKISNNEKINVLYVDGICGTGKTLKNIERFFNEDNKKNIFNLITYSTLIDEKSLFKPQIKGLVIKEQFIQPPWEWRSFTPQAHLDRLENYDIKASLETENCIGFINQEIKQNVEEILGYSFLWCMVFAEEIAKIQTSSGVSSFDFIPNNASLHDLKTKYKNLIEEKKNFILINGLTHFIENNLFHALLISELCPVCKIIYMEETSFYQINSNEFKSFN